MIYFHEQALFDSGPASIDMDGLSLKVDEYRAQQADGVTLHAHGRDHRRLTQRGWLLADSRRQLIEKIHAIEAMLDGQTHELVDADADRRWPEVVMTRLRIEPFVQVGARWKASYRIDYTQPRPQESTS